LRSKNLKLKNGRDAGYNSFISFCFAKNLQLKNGRDAIFGMAKAAGFRQRKG
jgi:hypothetical protein